MGLYVVACDNQYPKIIRAENEIGAVRSRMKDPDDNIPNGAWAVWKLGNFPLQFLVDGDPNPRILGRPSIKR